MNTRYINLYRFFYHFIDLLVLNLLFLILNFNLKQVQGFEKQYMLLYLVVNMLWLISSYVTGVYINDHHFNVSRYVNRTIRAFCLYVFLTNLLIFFYHFYYSRVFIFLFFSLFSLSLLFIRGLFYSLSLYANKGGSSGSNVVILGNNYLTHKLVEYISDHNPQIHILGFFDDSQNPQAGQKLDYLGNHADCIKFAIENKVTEIYSTLSPEKFGFLYELANKAEANMIRFKFIPDLHMFVNRKIHVDFIKDIPVISLWSEPLEDGASRIKKRLFDIVFSSFILIFVLSWLFPILAILILFDSRGPVLYIQKRSGKNLKPFYCFKFRSLTVSKGNDSVQVSRNDSRLTRLGRILRKTNLDELPQFINVLTGSMSVVGPRPHMLQHTEKFSAASKEYKIRHFVTPGISGWAQVNGFRGEITKDEHLSKRVEHDIWYMENWSLTLDCKIIYLTMANVFKGEKNAY